MNTPRRRRRLLPAALALAALAALTVIGAALYGADPVRVVALLQNVLRSDFGLALSYDGEPRLTFWPRPGVALDDYRIDVVATGKPLAWGDALALEVPWRALRSDRIEIDRIALDGPVFHAAALEGWRDGTARAALRWPRVASGIVVEDAKYIGAGVPPRVIEGLDFEVSPIEPGTPLTLRAAWRGADRDDSAGARAVRLALEGTPNDTPAGLALDALSFELEARDLAPARFRGRASLVSARRWSLEGTLEAVTLPTALARYVVSEGPQAATSLAFALDAANGEWHVVADGELAGSSADADFRITELPDFERPLPEWLASLHRGAHGHLRIARMHIGDVVLEGVELTNDDTVARDSPSDPAATAEPVDAAQAATQERP
ncbi:MAG TPA: hypothetical protein VND91_12785 [Candidatus Saccharimonadia bacterium]|nr:hypothetical protein [Candidatus Saccharimonadia bacterium]